jgi:hypothetical protein
MRTFYEARAVERRRIGGAEDDAVDVAQSSERAQLAAANGTGRRGHLSTQIERVTF